MSDSDPGRAEWLVFNPTESLTVELKTWIDPGAPESQAKIVKTAMALRNRDGGSLVIGFNNKTRQPDPNPLLDVRGAFNGDDIQLLISKHSSEAFEITVEFVTRDGQDHPVISVPRGVRTPVAVKKPAIAADGRELVKLGEVPFRSLLTNGNYSTANAGPGDWKEILEICFENREADIGRFVRRHLSSIDDGVISKLSSAITGKNSSPQPSLEERARELLEVGRKRYDVVKAERGIDAGAEEAVLHWGTWEVAAIIDPPIEGRVADQEFYNLLVGSNPQFQPWPSWPDVRGFGFQDNYARPETRDGGWESLVIAIAPRNWPFDFLHFMRLDPTGQFYQLRALDDDSLAKGRGGRVGSSLDPSGAVIQVADSIAVAMRYAKAVGCDDKKTNIGFAFRWRGLADRSLFAWSQRIATPSGYAASDDDASSFVQVPLTTAESALAPIVEKATKGLFAKFCGYSMEIRIIEQLIRRLLSKSV